MKKIVPLITLILTLVFEIIPYGAVCNFATPEKTIRQTYSYFDLVPFGYANFAPLITAILTCVLIVICIISLFKNINKTITVLSLITSIISLTPILYGIRYFSVAGAIISALLLTTFILSFQKKTN